MARDIQVKKQRKRSKRRVWPLIAVAVLVLAAAAVLYFWLCRDTTPTLTPEEQRQSELDSLLNNPNATCYTHSPDYVPPKLVHNHYSAVFNDENDVQLEAAQRNGIEELPSRVSDYSKYGLVELKENDFYIVDTLKYSVPYLVPAARVMLNTIGKCFQEVLAEKYPKSKYKIIVTSVLRTSEDVSKLVRRNRWATENSCHRHGTTIDISYYNFEKISGRDLGAWEMKEVLAIALAELRDQGLCYVKYERRNCFHVTLNNLNVNGITVTPSSNKKKDGGKTSAEKERKVYKNKDAERLHQKDEEKRSHKPHNYGKKYDDRPSPML